MSEPRSAPAAAERAKVRTLIGLTAELAAVPEVRQQGEGDVVDGVRVRRLVLTSPGGGDVPCLYLTPGSEGPWPGVVAVHQHNGEFHLGKSEPAGLAGDPAMAYGAAMARLGVAVVVPDLLGFEDRRGTGRLGDREYELSEAFHLLAVGTTLQAQHVRDVALAVSFLGTQADVTDRIGVIGHSLGGQVALFATACDPRIGAAVLSCGVGTVESFHRESVLHNPAWYVPGIIPAGDVPAVAAVAAGQTFWVSAGSADPLFPLDGVEAVVAGFPAGAAELHVFDGGHAFPPEVAGPATTWLARSLGATAAG